MRTVIGLSLICFSSIGQNLVPNSAFEEYVKCPNGFNTYGQSMNIPHWYSPSLGTPDYFNECSPRESKARMNWAGRCEDFNGNAYVGIITFMDRRSYREYLAVELFHPLDSGIAYSIQFSFRLSSYSKVSSGNIGLAFTPSPISAKHDKTLQLKPALVAMPDSAIVKKTGSWQTIGCTYAAKGDERFLIIGNFSETSPIYKIKSGGFQEPMLQYASFYYIDDVVVQRQVEFLPDLPLAMENENPFKTDSVIVLKNVQFEYNSAELNKISEAELNRLFNFLNNNAGTRIEISGHTDDQGSDEYNKELSLRRAKAVAHYLIRMGVDPGRLTYVGYGKSRPLINSTDEMARGINRRVEVKLVE